LADTTATQVDQYAAFIHATADDVVEQALTYVFSKDRDFQEFLEFASSPHHAHTSHPQRPEQRCNGAACKEACNRSG